METPPLLLPALTDHGEVITFYAYREAASRTAALANLALLLARQRGATSPVLMIDWALDAPGLQQLFGQPRNRSGVLELFEACQAQLALHRPNGSADDTLLAYEVLAALDWQQYLLRVDEGSQLYLMPAGRLDEHYSERLARLNWEAMFQRCPALFRCFAAQLACHFRHVLVDAASGVAETAGLCTTLLPRKLVVLFGAERSSLDGACAMVRRAANYRCSHEDEQRPLLVYPLALHLEADDDQQRLQRRYGDAARQPGYQARLEQLLSECYGVRQIALDSYCDEVQLQRERSPVQGERLAVAADLQGDRLSQTRSYQTLLMWLEPGYLPWQSRAELDLLSQLPQAQASAGAATLTARLQWQLGVLYGQQQHWRQALDCHEQGMRQRQQVLGADHPETLTSMAALAQAQRQLGRLDEARFLLECVAEARTRLLGVDHPDTLVARQELAGTLGAQGMWQRALALYDEVLAGYARLAGGGHVLTLSCMSEKACQLYQQGELLAARSLQEQVLAERKRLLGSEHTDTLASRTALAWTMLRLEEPDVAHSLLDAVLQICLKRTGPYHPAVRQARAQLAQLLKRTGSHAGQHPGQPPEPVALLPELRQEGGQEAYDTALGRPMPPLGAELAQKTAAQLLALDSSLAGGGAGGR